MVVFDCCCVHLRARKNRRGWWWWTKVLRVYRERVERETYFVVAPLGGRRAVKKNFSFEDEDDIDERHPIALSVAYKVIVVVLDISIYHHIHHGRQRGELDGIRVGTEAEDRAEPSAHRAARSEIARE